LIFRERITDQELVAELSRAAVMIYTSRLEPFGFAPLEANACGLPVVAIGEGGVRETVRDGFNGVVVSNRNPADIGAAVLGLLRDPKRIRQLGENGREWVAREWTWARCVETLEHALIEVRSLR
jgi:glycosyltransferase involved in cell wall biosynthesis